MGGERIVSLSRRRNLLMQSGGGEAEPSLPSEYQRIEYIERTSSAQGLISVSGLVKQNDTVEVSAFSASKGGAETYPANLTGSTGTNQRAWGICCTDFAAQTYGASDYCTIKSVEAGTPTVITALISNNDALRSVNIGNQRSDNFTGRGLWFGRFYKFKVVRSGETVFHAVPAKRISDSVAGLYDFVGEIFYPPSTGSFIAGSPV